MKAKKKTKTIFITIIGILIIGGAAALWYAYPMFSMKPVETGYILDTGIAALKNKSNSVFLINTENGYLLVDGGSDNKKLEDAMEKLSVDPVDVKYILMTHTDYDHVAGLSLCPNAEILLSSDEMQMIDGTTKRNLFQNNSLPEGVDSNELTLLEDGDILELGGHTIECIAAPGHTKGSMMYLVDDEYLFTGDAFKILDNNISVHPYSMDKEVAENTIMSLEPIFNRCKLVITAHYGYYEADELTSEESK